MRILFPGNRPLEGAKEDYSAGFILLEMLVVLLVFLMVIGTMLAGISYLIRIERELKEQDGNEQNEQETSTTSVRVYVVSSEDLSMASSRRYSASKSDR